MNRIYFYKLTNDDGGAPCVEAGMLSLAICKPRLRSTAQAHKTEGDIVLGLAADKLERTSKLSKGNKLIYAARIQAKETDGKYYKRKKYAKRGDCIYEFIGGQFVHKKKAKYHGTVEDQKKDIGPQPYKNANVLLSKDFRYFGRLPSVDYRRIYPAIGQAVTKLQRGHRIDHTQALERELHALISDIWRLPQPAKIRHCSKPSKGVCYHQTKCSSFRLKGPKC